MYYVVYRWLTVNEARGVASVIMRTEGKKSAKWIDAMKNEIMRANPDYVEIVILNWKRMSLDLT